MVFREYEDSDLYAGTAIAYQPRQVTMGTGLAHMGFSLRHRIKRYQRRAEEVESYLYGKPEEWGRFQSEFNAEINSIFRDVMDYERIQSAQGANDRVVRLKDLFIRKFRPIFMRGVYGTWSIDKPYGYAGDFRIIDHIYENNPTTVGFDRLFDNYYQMSAISVAVRNRKEDFKRIISSSVSSGGDKQIRVMNLASGPCREMQELFSSSTFPKDKVIFDCYESEPRAIEYAKHLLGNQQGVNFFKTNAVRLSLAKDLEQKITTRYDLIYTTGLFDYFNHKISVRLIRNLRKILKVGGVLAISDVRDKYSNPSVHYMEWAGDWNLIYRTDDEFRSIFHEAGFVDDELKTSYEQQGIMQYIIATKMRE